MSGNEDGWVEMQPGGAAAKRRLGCALRGLMTRGKNPQRRISLTFRLDGMDGEVARALITANRLSAAFNARLGALRLRPRDDGRFEMSFAPRSNGRVLLLRLPHPDGFEFRQEEAAFEPDLVDGAILIDMPRGYQPQPRPAPGANIVPASRVGRGG